jgi:hypothetical protein
MPEWARWLAPVFRLGGTSEGHRRRARKQMNVAAAKSRYPADPRDYRQIVELTWAFRPQLEK